MDARGALRSKNRFEEVMPSGLTFTIRLPRLRDCIIAGQVPIPVLKNLITPNGDAPEPTPDETAHMARFQDEIVLHSVVAIDGEPVKLTSDDLPDIRTEDYNRIVELALRESSPKAGTPT